MNIIQKYFPEMRQEQIEQLLALTEFYAEWNQKINVVSRKDIENLTERHVLHSLGIACFFNFKKGTSILDVGTGGGFPGIPLAIMFPEVKFHLVDSIGKKIKVVQAAIDAFGLKNAKASHLNVKNDNRYYDFVVSRAVTNFPDFVELVRKNITKKGFNSFRNGIVYLKGGDFNEELKDFKNKIKVHKLDSVFEEAFFETKKVIHFCI